jgi:hypothetical protein
MQSNERFCCNVVYLMSSSCEMNGSIVGNADLLADSHSDDVSDLSLDTGRACKGTSNKRKIILIFKELIVFVCLMPSSFEMNGSIVGNVDILADFHSDDVSDLSFDTSRACKVMKDSVVTLCI